MMMFFVVILKSPKQMIYLLNYEVQLLIFKELLKLQKVVNN